MLLSENRARRGWLSDVAVNEDEMSVNVMGQPCSFDGTAVVACAEKAAEQVGKISESFRNIQLLRALLQIAYRECSTCPDSC